MALFTKRYFLELSKEQYDAIERWAKDFELNKKAYLDIGKEVLKMRKQLREEMKKDLIEKRTFKPNR